MVCYFCQKNVKEIDYKDVRSLQKYISAMAKIKKRKKTGNCAYHQRKIAQAIKRARYLSILPYTPL